MQNLLNQVKDLVQDTFETAFKNSDKKVELEYCDLQFGHFATNIALMSSKDLNLSPLVIAEKLTLSLESNDIIRSVEVKSPGFINITLTDQAILGSLSSTHEDVLASVDSLGAGKKMIIDYSHPNIGKPMGVHHLLSTIIGDSIKRIYKATGHEVVADNFIGDLGTQFGKLIHAVKTWGDMNAIEANPVPELLKLYVKFHNEAEEDELLDEAGRAEYKKIEQGDPENRELLKKIQAWSMAEMLAVYEQLRVEFDYFNGESFYEDKIESIINLGIKRGLFVESQGALVCETDNANEPPALIRKKDGTSLYLTRDLARIAYWEKTWHPDYMVNVVDVAQSLQLKQVYEVASKLKLTDADNVHVAFGRMQFADGSMSTRKGNIILVEDLISQTKSRVRDQVVSLSKDLSPLEQADLTDILAFNCIKYNILRQNRISNISFDWESMLSLDGNSAPYLSYTAVRMKALKKQGEVYGGADRQPTGELSEIEIEIILKISRIGGVVKAATKNYQPSDIANYCYDICRLYNSFYHAHRVVEDGVVNNTRLLISNSVLSIVERCFDLLGLQVPDRM